MASKRKLNQSVSLTHFGITSKKVALRDEDAPKDDAGADRTVGPLATHPVTPQKNYVKLRLSAPKTQ